jgi:HD-GYP domain-containing protein (c-di-GMP phosphodiesterase class II)
MPQETGTVGEPSAHAGVALLPLSEVGPNGLFDTPCSLSERLHMLHRALRAVPGLDGVGRIAVATYDAGTDQMRTFIDSSDRQIELAHYRAPLAQTTLLLEAAQKRSWRVLTLHPPSAENSKRHSRSLYDAGYRSSLAVPFYDFSGLLGFVFFNATGVGFFDGGVPQQLWPYVQLISLMITNELAAARVARAGAKTIQGFSKYKDTETATHQERMAHYSRLIALENAERWQLTDEFIEHLFWFAPLHDIGKVGVPDNILLKPGKLTDDEIVAMKKHVAIGIEIVTTMMNEFHLDGMPHIRILYNAVACHHECVDGSGYPNGLAGDQIPLEGRIFAVADVFDALTGERPYKKRWTNAAALDYLRGLAGKRFDPVCVETLANNLPAIEEIQLRFARELPV